MICDITGKTCDCPKCGHCKQVEQENNDDGIATLCVVVLFSSLTLMLMGLLRFMGM